MASPPRTTAAGAGPLPEPIRVVGCGSPLGDDAVGWEVVAQLRRRLTPDAAGAGRIAVHAVEGGHQLLDLLDGRGTLILVDAAASGAAPGAIRRLDWPDPRLRALRPGSTHHLRPAEALALAESLALLPPRVVVFAVEATRFEPGATLAPAVAAAVPRVTERVLVEIGADA